MCISPLVNDIRQMEAKMKCRREVIGETLGTFLLVLVGCGSVATTVLFHAHQGLLSIALVWGIGVTLAIYLTRRLSCAHLNPAVTVTSAICLVAPLTQAGLNPARDLGPRLVAWLTGWGDAAFPDRVGGFFHVYVLAPVLGAVAAARFFVRVLEPALRDSSPDCGCGGKTCG